MNPNYQNLKTLFQKRNHLHHAIAICHWDEAAMMPVGGGEARAEALAALQSLEHELITAAQLPDLIAAAKNEDLQSDWDRANLLQMERIFQRAICLPTEWVSKSSLAFSRAQQAWRQMRAANNWQAFMPYLEENFKWIREAAEIKAAFFNCEPYDALIDDYSPGLTQKIIDPMFQHLKEILPAKIAACSAKQQQPISLTGNYPIANQQQLNLAVMQELGFDFNRGRLDISHHPFCGGVPQDVRITTRYQLDSFLPSLMGVCHETGHALYEQHLPQEWLDQPVGGPLGMTMHESQSLFIEMQVCRSLPFLRHLVPLVNQHLASKSVITAEQLYANYTHVAPGLIRVDADELCYPLHVILRYELEQQLIQGKIEVKDLPELWDEAMQRNFGLSTRHNDADGVLQDVHWPSGAVGYFPAYTIGAIIAAQLMAAIKNSYSSIDDELAQGNIGNLIEWLQQRIHGKGRLLSMSDLIREATGKPLTVADYVAHLQLRYCS